MAEWCGTGSPAAVAAKLNAQRSQQRIDLILAQRRVLLHVQHHVACMHIEARHEHIRPLLDQLASVVGMLAIHQPIDRCLHEVLRSGLTEAAEEEGADDKGAKCPFRGKAHTFVGKSTAHG